MQLIMGLLRIIGILIPAVFLLVLVVVFLILVCPVRYKAVVTRELSDPPKGFAKATWLWHLLSVRVDYDERLDYRIKILGFTILKGEDVPASQDHDNNEESDQSVDKTVETAADEWSGKASGKGADKLSDKESEKTPDKTSDKGTAKGSDNVADKAHAENGKTIAERIAELLQMLADFIEKISLYPDMILEKLEEWQQKKEKWMKQFQDEQHRTAVKAVFGTAGSILMHLKPTKLRIDGRLGFEDPAVTGQVFGLIGMLMPFYGETIHLEAVFDEAVAEGRLEMGGRIRLGTLICLMIRLIGKKEVRRLITQVKQLKRHK